MAGSRIGRRPPGGRWATRYSRLFELDFTDRELGALTMQSFCQNSCKNWRQSFLSQLSFSLPLVDIGGTLGARAFCRDRQLRNCAFQMPATWTKRVIARNAGYIYMAETSGRNWLENGFESSKRGQSHSKHAVASLATKLSVLTENPRDACLRLLHHLGVSQKRIWRPWTRPEVMSRQLLFEKATVQ